ncbi:hypothetical protein A6395_13935 [Exiguobacterium sp. SH31]|uniref:hypothetical protein n=1 Tax=Exiguobacterium sp. SH31 TaxID=1843183 RepID=UPI0008CBEE36|nr:hypothetical protein [Exiguobacterium sp. SH31]OGX78065.1 hypothetical protein A6395_13935 [Exiguobacterium sp. SH31]
MSKQLFYIKQDRELQRFTLHGVTLTDVVEALSIARPMIICRTDIKGMRQSSRTRFRYIEAHELSTFSTKYLNNQTSFTAIDFPDYNLLESLSDHEIAEILFLSHMERGLKAPFLNSIQNEIAYFNESNDRHSSLYIKDWSTINQFLQSVLQSKLDRDIRNISFVPIPLPVIDEILALSPQGLIIDFDHTKRSLFNRQVAISFYVAGRYEDMSVLEEDFDAKKESIALKGQLTYRRRAWEIERF